MTAVRRSTCWVSGLVIVVVASVALGGCIPINDPLSSTPKASESLPALATEFQALELEYDARVGVYAIDTVSGGTVAWRENERFAYASTFKALVAGAILKTVADLNTTITYTASDLVGHSPVTEQHVLTGMSIYELAEATVRTSDNTAANLLLNRLGGPGGLGAVLSEMGDTTTNPVRYELELNTAIPGDVRDTSTPRALADTLRALLLDGALSGPEAEVLTGWMVGNATGAELIRAGTPADWVVADKSGAGDYGTRNDIAVVWPPSGAPIAIAVLSSRSAPDASRNNALVAKAARVALSQLGGG